MSWPASKPARRRGSTGERSITRRTELQPGDEQPTPFSFLTDHLSVEQIPCWITYTNEAVHQRIRENLHRAPMYSGQIRSSGPRYCPSIEDKVVRFADKDRHQLFLEPEGRSTHEVYVNGVSTSLPRDVQDEIIRLVPGLERAEIMRYGYAVEYDFAPPHQLHPWLETKQVAGLFFAGQLNGTTGYEEAAAQGLVAGANAALRLAGKEPLVLDRNQAYIGVLVDDLVTRGVDEPYRMFTSRAEYRLLLRQDNADRRLTPLGRRLGLVDAARWQRLAAKEAEIQHALEVLDRDARGACHFGETAAPARDHLAGCRRASAGLGRYLGGRQRAGGVRREVLRLCRAAGRRDCAPAAAAGQTDPRAISIFRGSTSLRAEAREKLVRVRPLNLAQASRISGITPADMALLLIHLSGK